MLRNTLKKIIDYSTNNLQLHKCGFIQGTPGATAITSANHLLLENAHIDEAVRFMPSLSSVSIELWRRAHETFLNHGLDTNSFLRIVTGNPTVLSRSPQKIITSLEYWRSCQFGENLMHLLITKYPELLNVNDGRRLLTQVTYLKGYVSTNKNVWRLLMNCPNLMEQSEAQIEEKLIYLQHEMRIEVPEIVKCKALAIQFGELRCRHGFLKRLGLFIPRSLKARYHEITNNPRLHKITDTSEKTFATKVCHVTLLEFEAFAELFRRELRRHQRDIDEDDLAEEEQ